MISSLVIGFALWTLAQQATGDAVGLATLLTQVGLSAVFLWQWQAERNLRIKRDEQLFAILERQGPVLSEAIQTLKEIQQSQRTLAASMPALADWERALRDLRDTTASIRDGGRHEGR
jgi:hypothetical protein